MKCRRPASSAASPRETSPRSCVLRKGTSRSDGSLEEVAVHATPKERARSVAIRVQVEGKLVALQQLGLDNPLKEGLDATEGERGEGQAQDALEREGGEDVAGHLPDHRERLLLHRHGASESTPRLSRLPVDYQ